eukprot:CAMPEP_0118935126 /NCGR_PEP_ID=MMETSP1169-20130426/14955_1 /TAXON_ID=36882 /ORGANISM="Pyramimonas obovata, Strain CCMP722" /LENGTH=375 /DNA_ID=CAMNT_0006878113 /DNA_START=113 /DNA_END=1240 /DNA_ORIENTATION=-
MASTIRACGLSIKHAATSMSLSSNGGQQATICAAQKRTALVKNLRLATPGSSDKVIARSVRVHANNKQTTELRNTSVNWGKEWSNAEKLMEEGTIFDTVVEVANRGGLVVRVGKLKGFIPASQISGFRLAGEDKGLQMAEKLAILVGQTLPVRVIKVKEDERQLVLSERAATLESSLATVQVGDVCKGVVRSTADFGSFVELIRDGELTGIEGLVHLSEMSWDRVANPHDAVSVDQEVAVKVISVDLRQQRVGLSMRQLMADPLLQTLDTLMPVANDTEDSQSLEELPPFPDLDNILSTLLAEDGVDNVNLGRAAMEPRVTSQDLELWLTNVTVEDGYNLLLRAGSQVQELHVTTPLDRDDFKNVVRRVSSKIGI